MVNYLKPEARRSCHLATMVLVAVLAGVCSGAGPAVASTQTFSNPAPIAIPASATSGTASPYPSSVVVNGMPGAITDVNVTLHRFGHTAPLDVDIRLVSPSGDSVIVMSDACDTGDIEDFTWVFDQAAATAMAPPCDGFVYRPTNVAGGDVDLLPGSPPGPRSDSLGTFNNENANGTWNIYVWDDGDQDVGDIEGGWSLTVTTGPADAVVPGTGTFGTASPYPLTRTLSGEIGVITDLNVSTSGIWHQRPDDLDLLPGRPRRPEGGADVRRLRDLRGGGLPVDLG